MSLLTVRSREGCLYHLEGLSPGDYHGVDIPENHNYEGQN